MLHTDSRSTSDRQPCDGRLYCSDRRTRCNFRCFGYKYGDRVYYLVLVSKIINSLFLMIVVVGCLPGSVSSTGRQFGDSLITLHNFIAAPSLTQTLPQILLSTLVCPIKFLGSTTDQFNGYFSLSSKLPSCFEW